VNPQLRPGGREIHWCAGDDRDHLVVDNSDFVCFLFVCFLMQEKNVRKLLFFIEK